MEPTRAVTQPALSSIPGGRTVRERERGGGANATTHARLAPEECEGNGSEEKVTTADKVRNDAHCRQDVVNLPWPPGPSCAAAAQELYLLCCY